MLPHVAMPDKLDELPNVDAKGIVISNPVVVPVKIGVATNVPDIMITWLVEINIPGDMAGSPKPDKFTKFAVPGVEVPGLIAPVMLLLTKVFVAKSCANDSVISPAPFVTVT